VQRLTGSARGAVAGLAGVGVVVVVACTACSGGAQREASRSVPPTPPPSFAPGLHRAGGTAYVFGVPTSPSFTPGRSDTTAAGARVQRFSHELRPGGPACTIVASEQPAYTGRFPSAPIQVFAALASPGDRIVHNEATSPPAGAAAALRQELTFTARLADGTGVPARLFQRQLLTPGRTLVQLTVAGPEDALDSCRVKDIAGSLQLTGAEAPSPSAGATS
jgi:hypothetical protein